ncbi:hypothetical protein [Bosea sp. Root670]|uniref:hypothetical protein n=1 Tax=Bosea sp. Root670 TaxID=1736583 RepID=UPI0012E33A35|nr:hypothetical protein [Bosea sp. Root670]
MDISAIASRHCGISDQRIPPKRAGLHALPVAATADREAEISADQSDQVDERRPTSPSCGGRMILVERFAPGTVLAVFRIDTS